MTDAIVPACHHFRGVTKMVWPGRGAERRVKSDEKKLEKQSGKLPRPDSEN